MDQGLGRNATNIEAGSAWFPTLDYDGIKAQLSGADTADIATRTSANNQKLASFLLHGSDLHKDRCRGFQQGFDTLNEHGSVPAIDNAMVETG